MEIKKIKILHCSDCPFIKIAEVDGLYMGHWCSNKEGKFFINKGVSQGFPKKCPLEDYNERNKTV